MLRSIVDDLEISMDAKDDDGNDDDDEEVVEEDEEVSIKEKEKKE